MLLEDDEDEIQIVQFPEDEVMDMDSSEKPNYPPMPDWMSSANPASRDASVTAVDMEDSAPPRRITLGRVLPVAAPEPTSRSTSIGAQNPPQTEPSSPVQVISSGMSDDEEEIVDLDEREDTPPRTKAVQVQNMPREADLQRSRPGLIDTQPQDDETMPLGTVSLPVSPPRLTIPPRLSMQRSISMNAAFAQPVPSPNNNHFAENEEIVDLDTREETPPPRVQFHQRHVGQRELDDVTFRQTGDYVAALEDDDIFPVEMDPIPMPASPPPEALPIAGIERTYSIAQPIANVEPSSKNNKSVTSLVAKARARVRAYKGTDPTTSKKGKGREGDNDDGPDLKKELSKLDAEITSIDKQVKPLLDLQKDLRRKRETILNNIRAKESATVSGTSGINGSSSIDNARAALATNGIPKARVSTVNGGPIDYMPESRSGVFEWSKEVKTKLRSVWGIRSFRLCQEGVINAVMDGRDVLCIMPTGGGKSLCYQLPALLTPGTTFVISPLISLMQDQVTHLQEAGVESIMLTGGLGKSAEQQLYARLLAKCTTGRTKTYPSVSAKAGEIKLCYVTPEKMVQSKELGMVIDTLNRNGKIARFVVDEAHCASVNGHDFRPDYKKLNMLKNACPKVPILAVTATLSRKGLPDLLKNLIMPTSLTDGRAANKTGTVLFTSPLYRPNLHYSVLPKPANTQAAIDALTEWILKHHLGEAGIVYCHSKKDAEDVAHKIRVASGNKIKTGWYHAELGDAQKESVHRRWRNGEIHLVVATIAFGLGIDKQDTRYVIHHTLPKSIDGLYQESGRAGRDGDDADCVLYYRAQDMTRMLALTVGEEGSRVRVHGILRYVQDLKTCRKHLFAKYFATTASLPGSGFDTGQSEQSAPCEHCDNCLRAENSIEDLDVTLEAWKIVKLVNAVKDATGRFTFTQLADVVRGLKTDGFVLVDGDERSGYAGADKKIRLNLDAICGGPAFLNKDQTESLVMQLYLENYLDIDHASNAYKTLVYCKPGPNALRLTRLPQDVVESGNSPLTVEISFPLPMGKKTTKKQAANGREVKTKLKKRKGTETPNDDPGISKKARMFSPDEDMPPVTGENGMNDEDGSDNSDNDGNDVVDDLAFYERLEQDLLEQKDGEEDYDIQADSEGNSSDRAVGWRSRI